MEPRGLHAGVLVIRAWIELGASPPLRLVVTSVVDVGPAGVIERVATTRIDEAEHAVRSWLDEMLHKAEFAN